MFSMLGCGYYSFSGSIPSHIKTVAVPLFEDQTTEYGVKEKLTNAVIDAFIADNTLKIVDQRKADSIVLGTILRIEDPPYTFDEEEKVQDYRLNIYVNVEFLDVKKNKTLFEEKLLGWDTYSALENIEEERQQAIDVAIKNLTDDILNKAISGW
ncbi:LptE family protein [candidate division KSB1 bacterium]|nr:LptE family protein [candidate division KSB1 bacterium]